METTAVAQKEMRENTDTSPEVVPNPFYKKNKKSDRARTDFAIADKIETVHAEYSVPFTLIQNLNSYKFLALDIDTDKIRYAVGKATGKDIHVAESGGQVLSVRENDLDKALHLTLANIKANHFKKGMKVHVSFYSPDITLKLVELPVMRKEKEIQGAIFLKLQTELARFSDDNIWRYERVESFEKEGQEFHRYIVLIVPKLIVNRYMNVLLRTGLKPETLIPRPVALINSYNRMMTDSGHDIIVDISYELTHLIGVHKGRIDFTRTLTSGAANLEAAVHTKKTVLMQPETFKVGEEPGIGKDGAIKPEAIRKVLKKRLRAISAQQNPVLQLFKNEIQNTIELLRKNSARDDKIRVCLTGYGIQKENLVGYLRNQISYPVFLLSPQLGNDLVMTYGEYSALIGAISGNKSPFNVVPDEYRSNAFYKQLNMVAAVAGFLVLTAITWQTHGVLKQVDEAGKELIELTRKYKKINPVQTEYLELRDKIKALDKENQQLKSVLQNPAPITRFMKLLSNETPQQIVLTEVSLRPYVDKKFLKKKNRKKKKNKSKKKIRPLYDYSVNISGYVNGDYLMSDVILINYVDRLKKLGFFKNIEVNDKTKRARTQKMTFDIKAQF
ncbi:MAG: hypothetical protein D6677_01800 [Calditrichaeota bacterium]|nr:MAG: hypothetical protein D6677_01800 [Calditrichota bacterium]